LKALHLDINKIFVTSIVTLFMILGGSNVTLVYLFGGVSKDIEHIKENSRDRYPASIASQDWKIQEGVDSAQDKSIKLIEETKSDMLIRLRELERGL